MMDSRLEIYLCIGSELISPLRLVDLEKHLKFDTISDSFVIRLSADISRKLTPSKHCE